MKTGEERQLQVIGISAVGISAPDAVRAGFGATVQRRTQKTQKTLNTQKDQEQRQQL